MEQGVALRVGIIEVNPEQDIDAAIEELISLGVDAEAINVDRMREVGRGDKGGEEHNADDALCGGCADGVVAVLADGTVKPCVFARDAKYSVGAIDMADLGEVLGGPRLRRERTRLTETFAARAELEVDCSPGSPCAPASGGPGCAPAQTGVRSDIQNCGPACSPSCIPVGNCNPVVNPPACNPISGHPPRPEPEPRPPGPICNPY